MTMTVSYFETLEREIPAVEGRQAMRLAQIAVYPHASKEGAERLWRSWSDATDTQLARTGVSRAFGVPTSGVSLNGQVLSFESLRDQLGVLLGRGIAA